MSNEGNGAGELTDQQALWLSEFSYLDLYGYEIEDLIDNNTTIKEFYEGLDSDDMTPFEINGGLDNGLFLDLLKNMSNDPLLGSLVFKAYENDNVEYNPEDGTGFKAYAFSDGEDTYFSFCGSEGANQQEHEGVWSSFLTKDWNDNISMGLESESVQFEQVEDFMDQNAGTGGNYSYGHSKGGANALYAIAYMDGVTGKVFDAQGISQILDETQRQRLRESGAINYVAEGDIVGVFLFHDEMICFVSVAAPDTVDGFKGPDDTEGFKIVYKNPLDYHYPQVIVFNEDGSCIDGERTPISLLVDSLVKTLYFKFNDDALLSEAVEYIYTVAENTNLTDAEKMALLLAYAGEQLAFTLNTPMFVKVVNYDIGIIEWYLAFQASGNANYEENYNVVTMGAIQHQYTQNLYSHVKMSYGGIEQFNQNLNRYHKNMNIITLELLRTHDKLTDTWLGKASETYDARFLESYKQIQTNLTNIETMLGNLDHYIVNQSDIDYYRRYNKDMLLTDQDGSEFINTELYYELDMLRIITGDITNIAYSLGDRYHKSDINQCIRSINNSIEEIESKCEKAKEHIYESTQVDQRILS